MPDADQEIEVVLAAYEAFARGDAGAAVADMDPEVEWIEPLSFAMGGRRVGPAAVAEYLEASRSGWKPRDRRRPQAARESPRRYPAGGRGDRRLPLP
jgi:ketosteroid isomerase-like protein